MPYAMEGKKKTKYVSKVLHVTDRRRKLYGSQRLTIVIKLSTDSYPIVIWHRSQRCASNHSSLSGTWGRCRRTPDRYRKSLVQPHCCRTSSTCRTIRCVGRTHSRPGT